MISALYLRIRAAGLLVFFQDNLPALLTPMATYIPALIRMLPMIYSILSGIYSVEFARKPFVKLKEMVSRFGPDGILPAFCAVSVHPVPRPEVLSGHNHGQDL